MNFHYNEYLKEQIILTQRMLQETVNFPVFDIVVEEEQTFIKRSTYEPSTIYVVVKYLSDTKQYDATIQPVQLMILSESDSLEIARTLFNTFAKDYNWQLAQESGTSTYVKQQYSAPVVLSNFQEEGYGFRSTLYMTGTLYIMENVLDFIDFKIDGKDIKPLNVTFTYTMTPNAQQLPSDTDNISVSVKSTSGIGLSFVIPPIYPELVSKCSLIMKGTNTGNEDFAVSFKIGSTEFSYNMKLVSATFVSAPNQIPNMSIGLAK